MKKRVVITGLGAVTPIGIGKDEFWQALLAGVSGVGKITRFDASEFTTQIAGEIKDFDATKYIDKKEAKRMDRCTQFAVAASKMAFEDSGINLETEDRFLSVLDKVDNYTIQNDTLSLNKSKMATLAKFIAVYLK